MRLRPGRGGSLTRTRACTAILRVSRLEERLTPAGQLDATFSNAGVATAGFAYTSGGSIYAAAIDGLGRLVAAGLKSRQSSQELVVTRYTPAGAIDTSFGVNGFAKLDSSTRTFQPTGLAVD